MEAAAVSKNPTADPGIRSKDPRDRRPTPTRDWISTEASVNSCSCGASRKEKNTLSRWPNKNGSRVAEAGLVQPTLERAVGATQLGHAHVAAPLPFASALLQLSVACLLDAVSPALEEAGKRRACTANLVERRTVCDQSKSANAFRKNVESRRMLYHLLLV